MPLRENQGGVETPYLEEGTNRYHHDGVAPHREMPSTVSKEDIAMAPTIAILVARLIFAAAS